MMTPILQTIMVAVILLLMMLMVLSVSQLGRRRFDADEQDLEELRRELEQCREVISDKSAFRQLVAKPVRTDDTNRFKPRG